MENLYNTKKVKALISKIGTQKDAAEAIGVSIGTVKNALNGKDLQISTLYKLGNYFNIPVSVFFDSDSNKSVALGDGSAATIYGDATAGQISDKDKEINYLKCLLESKDSIIEEKERTIQILMNK